MNTKFLKNIFKIILPAAVVGIFALLFFGAAKISLAETACCPNGSYSCDVGWGGTTSACSENCSSCEGANPTCTGGGGGQEASCDGYLTSCWVSSSMDCDPGGSIDNPGTCDGVVDCNGVCNGGAEVDCNNTCGGSATVDACGVCGGDGSSCAGCDGVPGSGKTTDACGTCGGSVGSVTCDADASSACTGSSASGTDSCGNSCTVDGTKDCGGSHLACSGEACVSVSGSGSNECSSDNDCKTSCTGCSASAPDCESTTYGTDSCNNSCSITNSDPCPTYSHTECSNNSCTTVSGVGSDSCASNADCTPLPPPPPSEHYECVSNSCSLVSGSSSDSCSTNADCAPVTHTECSGNSCVSVFGSGSDTCTSNADCTSCSGCSADPSSACVGNQAYGVDSCNNPCSVSGSSSCACSSSECGTYPNCTSPSGCDNTCGSTKTFDCAGNCGGSAVVGCDGVCNSGKTLDDCGICGGDSSSCANCPADQPCGSYPNCTTKSGCDHTCGSTKFLDSCGVCGGPVMSLDCSAKEPSCEETTYGIDLCGNPCQATGPSCGTTTTVIDPPGSVHAYNSSTDPLSGTDPARAKCGRVRLSWTDSSAGLASFRLYRDGTKLADVAAGSPTSYSFAEDSSLHNYEVAAFIGSDFSSQADAMENPTGAKDCKADLTGSDKDIIKVNSTDYSSQSQPCNGSTDTAPILATSFTSGDRVTFQINLCNNNGSDKATGIVLTDTLTNLKAPSATSDFNIRFNNTALSKVQDCTNPGVGAYSVCGSEPNQTIIINLSGPAFDISPGLKNSVVLDTEISGTATRFQNSFSAAYQKAAGSSGVIRGSIPLIPFYSGSSNPTIIER